MYTKKNHSHIRNRTERLIHNKIKNRRKTPYYPVKQRYVSPQQQLALEETTYKNMLDTRTPEN
jgi:hypothetical protein